MINYTRSKKFHINSAEFGIYRGIGSLMMETYFGRYEGSQHYAFDSFEGLSKPQPIDNRPDVAGIMSPSLTKTQKLLSKTKIYQGWIPEDLPQNFSTKLDFVHIDLDLYEPIKGALNFIHPLLKPGAIILIDDYSTNWPGAMEATNEYVESHMNKFLNVFDHMTGLLFLQVR